MNAGKRPVSLAFGTLAAAAFILAGALPAFSQDAAVLDESRGIIVALSEGNSSSGDEAALFLGSLENAVRGAFAAQGLALEAGPPRNDPEAALDPAAAAKAGSAAGVRWVVSIYQEFLPQRLTWRVVVFDAKYGGIRAADAYSTYPGLTALPFIDDSAAAVAASWKSVADTAEEEFRLVEVPQRFRSKDDGVSLRYGLGDEGGRYIGTVEDGALQAAYVPFRRDEPVTVEIYRDGYWSKTLVLKKGVQNKTVILPRLQKRTETAWGGNAGVGRMLGGAATYRWYPYPDRAFLKAEEAVWAGYDFMPGSSPTLHSEFRLGFGSYVQKATDAKFRVAMGAGFSLIGSVLTNAPQIDVPAAVDLTLEPFWLTLEYHFPAWAVVFEQRLPYALGTGYLPPGWMSIGDGGPLFFSLGVMLKW